MESRAGRDKNNPHAMTTDTPSDELPTIADNRCPECGAPIPADSPLGTCPSCMLKSGLTGRGGLSDEFEPGFLDDSSNPDAMGVLDGYVVLDVIGQGATGIVLKAEEPALGRKVAIKVLRPALATSSVSRERFLREARAIAAISHEHVVTIHAVGEWKEVPYLAMAFIVGKTLKDRIRSSGTLKLKEILRIGHQVCSGLAKTHAQGIIHRDIKPANVLLENSVERVKLTDFGLARVATEQALTLTGYVSGTPGYTAPELFQGRPADERADLFSVGCLVYAMAAGQSPFHGSSVAAAIRNVVEGKRQPLREANPDMPEWLADKVDALLNPFTTQRERSAAELGQWFEERLAEIQSAGSQERSEPAATGRSSRQTIMAATGALLLAIAGGGWFAWKANHSDNPTPPTSGPGPTTPDPAVEQFRTLFKAAFRSRVARASISPRPAFDGRRLDLVERAIRIGRHDANPLSRRGCRRMIEEHPEAAALWDNPRATFVLLLTGGYEGRGIPDRMVKQLRQILEPGPPPAGGVWVTHLPHPAVIKLLPPDQRKPGTELWVVLVDGQPPPPADRRDRPPSGPAGNQRGKEHSSLSR